MLSITEQQFELITSVVYQKLGIYIGTDKNERLQYKLENMIHRGFCSNIDELCEQLLAGNNQCLLELTDCITTCHTFFFREKEHFDDLIADIQKNQHSNPIYIWSAACSTGEEPYSIVMSLLNSGISDFHVVASDVNRDVLSSFNEGVYHQNRLLQTPVPFVRKYFERKDDSFWQIDKNLRKYISIKKLNLMEQISFPRQFDAVFCRNVFIYFNDESRAVALQTIVNNLRKGGLLFIGHAEVLFTQPQNLKKIGNSIYCKI
jgi:chemotaxis protein methyltransferase CheR